MISKDNVPNIDNEELQSVSGGFIPPLPKSVEIHKVDEHTGADMKAGLPAGKIISEADMQNVNGGLDLDLFDFDADPNDFEHKHSIRNIYTAD